MVCHWQIQEVFTAVPQHQSDLLTPPKKKRSIGVIFTALNDFFLQI